MKLVLSHSFSINLLFNLGDCVTVVCGREREREREREIISELRARELIKQFIKIKQNRITFVMCTVFVLILTL
jgi:hypothetical protein